MGAPHLSLTSPMSLHHVASAQSIAAWHLESSDLLTFQKESITQNQQFKGPEDFIEILHS